MKEKKKECLGPDTETELRIPGIGGHARVMRIELLIKGPKKLQEDPEIVFKFFKIRVVSRIAGKDKTT
jgi:hypothetical protein